jgi:hypothetical protein
MRFGRIQVEDRELVDKTRRTIFVSTIAITCRNFRFLPKLNGRIDLWER